MKYTTLPQLLRYIAIYPCVVFISIFITGTSEPAFGQWTKHIIDPSIAYSCFIAVHDMGDDGDMDVFIILNSMKYHLMHFLGRYMGREKEQRMWLKKVTLQENSKVDV